MVKNGELKYFMISDGGMGGRGGSAELTQWIKEHGTAVPTEEWKSTGNNNGESRSMQDRRGQNMTLYEVKL
ncbi:hypothetical protein [Paenibacillus piri]|uniref:hypothetical protein n=1 Tax=Paenibacillus piri TaxID=2547395 RepID=UPI00319E0780